MLRPHAKKWLNVVAYLLRNSNWWSRTSCFSPIIFFSLLKSNVSNNLGSIGSSELSLYDLAPFNGFPSFSIVITSVVFHETGIYFSLNAACHKCVILAMPFLGRCFNISSEIRLYPGVSLGSIFF